MLCKHTFSRLFAVSIIAAFLLTSFPKFSPLQAQDIQKEPETIFSNTTPITINTAPVVTAPTTSSLYPSTINVSGMTGTVTRVAVTLRGLTHARTGDMDFLLVSPTGAKFIFPSDPRLLIFPYGISTDTPLLSAFVR